MTFRPLLIERYRARMPLDPNGDRDLQLVDSRELDATGVLDPPWELSPGDAVLIRAVTDLELHEIAWIAPAPGPDRKE